jgi:hypothetical protein
VNICEARIVRNLLGTLNFAAEAAGEHLRVAVLTGYLAQVDEIRRTIGGRRGEWRALDVEVSTVDVFQGRKADVDIFTLTRSNADRQLGFLRRRQRVNVALSRGRDAVVIVGDAKFIRQHPDDSNALGVVLGTSRRTRIAPCCRRRSMTPEEVARRYGVRTGYRLVSYREVGLPFWNMNLRCQVLDRTPLSPLDEFVLKSIDAELSTADEVAAFLGLPEVVVVGAMAQLVSRGSLSHLPARGDDPTRFALTSKGRTELAHTTEVSVRGNASSAPRRPNPAVRRAAEHAAL